MKKAKYLSLLAMSALLVGCGPSSAPTSAPTVAPTETPTSTPTVAPTETPTSAPTVAPTETPTEAPYVGPASVGLIGSMEESSWNLDIPLTGDDQGKIWTLEDYPFYEGDEWKLRAEGSWDLQWGYSNLDEASAPMFEEAGEYGGNVKVLESAYYTLSLDAEEGVLTVTKGEELIPSWQEVYAGILESHDYVTGGTVESYRLYEGETEPEADGSYTYEIGNDKNGAFVKATEVTSWSTIVDYYVQTKDHNWTAVTLDDDNNISGSYVQDLLDLEWGSEYAALGYRAYINGATGLLDIINDGLSYPNASAVYDSENNLWSLEGGIEVLNENYPSANRVFLYSAQVQVGEYGELSKLAANFLEFAEVTEDLESGHWVPTTDTYTNAYIYQATQTAGERTLENPIDIDSYFYTSWDLAHVILNEETWQNEIGDVLAEDEVIVLNNGTTGRLTLVNPQPETASYAIDVPEVTVTKGNEDGLSTSFSEYNGVIFLNTSTEGEYEVTISTAAVSKTVSVKVNPAAAESVSGYVYWMDGDMYSTDMLSDGESGSYYVGSEVVIGAGATPYAADSTATYEVVSGAEYVDSEALESFAPNSWSDPKSALKLSLKSAGEVVVKITNKATPTVSATITIEIVEVPSLEELLSHEYVQGNGGNMNVHVVFTPSADDIKVGTVSIGRKESYDAEELAYAEYSYIYDETTKVFALKDADGNADTENVLSFNSKYQLSYGHYSLSVLSAGFYFSGTSWSARLESLITGDITNAWIGLEIYNSCTEGYFNFFTQNANFEQVVDSSASIHFEIVKIESGYELVLDAKSLEELETIGEISDLSITWNEAADTITFSLTSKTYGEITASAKSGY